MKYSVCSPVGGYGNHLRWLMYLSKDFQCIPIMKNKKDFITSYVYHKQRDYYNWLTIEWRFRRILDRIIHFEHNVEKVYSYKTDNRVIVLTSRPKLAFTAYYKFNPSINGHDIKSFMRHVNTDNKSNIGFKTKMEKELLVLNSAILYNELLDRELYNAAVNFYSVENVYDFACEIHALWYEAHKRAESNVLNIDFDTWKVLTKNTVEDDKFLSYKSQIEKIYK